MARRAKAFSEYPQWTMEVITRISAGERLIQMPQPDRNTCVSSVHMFNRARKQFVQEQLGAEGTTASIKMAEIALDIICRMATVSGKHYIEFVPRGLAITADAMRPSGGNAAPAGQRPVTHQDIGVIPGIDTPLPADAVRRPAPPLKHVLDPHDRMLQQMLGVELPDLGPDNTEPCAENTHEADATGTFCLRCGRPVPSGA